MIRTPTPSPATVSSRRLLKRTKPSTMNPPRLSLRGPKANIFFCPLDDGHQRRGNDDDNYNNSPGSSFFLLDPASVIPETPPPASARRRPIIAMPRLRRAPRSAEFTDSSSTIVNGGVQSEAVTDHQPAQTEGNIYHPGPTYKLLKRKFGCLGLDRATTIVLSACDYVPSHGRHPRSSAFPVPTHIMMPEIGP